MIWYKDAGQFSEYVLSTRVRIARNIIDYPFPANMSRASASELISRIENALGDGFVKTNMLRCDSQSIAALTEKRLISPEFAKSAGEHSLFLSEDERVSVMACEEDHIRIQAIVGGFKAREAFNLAYGCEEKLDSALPFAYDERLGYITHCPTNLGTALRISVMMFLPGLTYQSKMRGVSEMLSKFGMTIRGVYGEGSESHASLYQISNQVTLGIDEEALLARLCDAVKVLIDLEGKARESLKSISCEDTVMRSLGALIYSRKMSGAEFEKHYSAIRLGIALGYIDMPFAICDEAYIEAQGSVIALKCKEEGIPNTPEERDIYRSRFLREIFSRR